MKKRGFTLIELMIVVAIIGILAAVAVPKFADLINKAKEGATKNALGAVRSALQVYYGDNEGRYPTDNLASLLPDGKYINEIPVAKLPKTGHDDKANVNAGSVNDPDPATGGGWAYFNDPNSPTTWGTFVVNCTHTNLKNEVWSTI